MFSTFPILSDWNRLSQAKIFLRKIGPWCYETPLRPYGIIIQPVFRLCLEMLCTQVIYLHYFFSPYLWIMFWCNLETILLGSCYALFCKYVTRSRKEALLSSSSSVWDICVINTAQKLLKAKSWSHFEV